MDVSEWQKRAGGVIDVGQLPKFSLKGRGRLVSRIALAFLVLIALLSTYYQVDVEEVAVVQRFGRFDRTTYPGPHVKIPFIETVTIVPVKRLLKAEFGFRTATAAIRSSYEPDSEETRGESQMLTGDLNVAVVEWIVQYKVKDPYQYLFKVRNLDSTNRRIETTFRDMNEAVMRAVIGDHSVNEVLTVGREIVQVEARTALQRLCDHYETGIEISQIVLQDVTPPDKVKPAFNEVNQAIQERERLINEAWADYNQTVPNARGEAERTIRAAEGYALERVNNAHGDVSRFVNIQEEYRKAPEVTRRRLYLETLADILPKTGRKLIVDSSMKGLLPLLNLDTIKQEAK